MGNKPGTLKILNIYMSLDNILKVKFGRYTVILHAEFCAAVKIYD